MRNTIGACLLGLSLGMLASCGRPLERNRSRSEPKPIQVREDGEEHRRVVHAAGETRIPAHPARIAALAFEDEVLALGLKPCAFTTTFGAIRPYAAAALAGSRPITPLYGASEPPFEAVLAARPDLILAGGITSSRTEGLSAIAPTVVLAESPGANGDRRRLLDVAAVLGAIPRAHEILADYDARVSAARQLLQRKIGNETVAVLRVRARKYNLFGASLTGPVLYEDLGLLPPNLVKARLLDRKAEVMVLDAEQLADLDVDHLFVVINPQLSSDRNTAALEDIPLWRKVPAVARGQVYYVSQTNWLARGLIARSVILDEVVTALLREGRFAAPAYSAQIRRQRIDQVFRDPAPVRRGLPLIPEALPHLAAPAPAGTRSGRESP